MRVNELLFWLSARKSGSWQQFKGAVEELHLPEDVCESEASFQANEQPQRGGLSMHQSLRFSLQRLAHVEFFAPGCEAGWRVAPPVLAVGCIGGASRAVLCGARTPALLDCFQRAANAHGLAHDSCGQPEGPDAVRVFASDAKALELTCTQAGLVLQRDAAMAVLAAAPAVPCGRIQGCQEFPRGRDWVVERFLPDARRWTESSQEEARGSREGLFRFRTTYEWRYFLRRKGATCEVESAAGKYAVLHRGKHSVLSYEPATQVLTVPVSCRPPLLVERALILCAGRLPVFQRDQTALTYTDVPPAVLRLAARLLGQEVHT